MKLIACIFIVICLIVLFLVLLKQSNYPTGLIGTLILKLWNKVYLPMMRWGLSFISDQHTHSILDIGIGNGASSFLLSQQYPTSTITGIDISKDAISLANKIYESSAITFVSTSIEQTDFVSHSFDLICACQTHFHWNNLDSCLIEIKRLLSPEGIFIIMCETAKIHYFLPDLKKADSFKNYLIQFNLTLLQVEQNNKWTFYKIH